MNDLTVFVKARLDEDERYLQSNRRHLWTQRPLREVEAKRAIVGLHRNGNVPDACSYCHEGWPCRTLRILAVIWIDHHDYDQEWKPWEI